MHEPNDEFVKRLEWQVGLETRRRNRLADAPKQSWWRSAWALAASMLISMAVGGAAVAAAYEAQASGRRDQIVSNLEQRSDLAKQRLALATAELASAERRFEVGIGTDQQIMDAGLTVAAAQAQIESIALDLAEVRITGQDPRNELSAPAVSGRDFVGERLRVALSVPEKTLALERKLAESVQRRVEIGTMEPILVEVSRARILDLEASIDTIRRKLLIRQQFLGGKMDKVEAELRVLETEAEQQISTLKPKLALATTDADRIAARVEVGTAHPLDLAAAKLRGMEMATALSKAELELAVVRRRIDQHRAGRD